MLPAAAQELWKAMRKADRKGAKARVLALRKRLPDADNEELHRLLVQLQWQQQAQAQPLVREWPPQQRGQAQRLRRLGLVLALGHGNKHPSQSG